MYQEYLVLVDIELTIVVLQILHLVWIVDLAAQFKGSGVLKLLDLGAIDRAACRTDVNTFWVIMLHFLTTVQSPDLAYCAGDLGVDDS